MRLNPYPAAPPATGLLVVSQTPAAPPATGLLYRAPSPSVYAGEAEDHL